MSSWTDWSKRIGSMFGREQLRARLVTTDPTKDYRATPFFASELVVNELPLFTLWQARLMERSDPVVSFSLNVRNAALMALEVEVEAKDPRVKAWVEKQWKTLWTQHRAKLVSAKRWGYSAAQPKFKEEPDGLLHISGLKTFAPHDVRALTHGSRTVGFQLRATKLYHPFGLWQTFGAEFNSPYGTGTLRRSYPPWYEKWMDRGAKKLVQLRMIKDAYIGDIFWYPPDQTITIPTADGPVQLSWRDVFREVGENRLSGAPMTLPLLLDANGKELSKYQPPQAIPGASQVFDWEDRLDKQILRGADVPLEVIEAQENGGFSGRSVPLMVLLGVCTQEACEIVADVDEHLLRPTVWLNFGKEPEYTIIAKSLMESFASDAGGSAMGGGAMGGQPGQERPPQRGGSQPPRQEPSHQPSQFDDSDHLRAPKGGVTIKGTFYPGGEYIPAEVVEQLSDADKTRIQSGTYGERKKKVAGRDGPRTKPKPLSDKAKRAKAAHHMVDGEIQRYAEEHNEPAFSKAIGGVSFPDGEPIDIAVADESGVLAHGIELKTMVDNKANKITMKREAMERKAKWERKNKAPIHTVVIDDSDVFNAKGPGKHDPTKRRMFYRRGYGSFRVSTMQEVKNIAELKHLMATPERSLPPAAQRATGQRQGKLAA